ncbi:MAG: F0F1 ATP synthase subunit A, partial [Erythrobacter sp.]|nr:F0F1 ATP synthase subunit A [Erythrobacter sp.]
MAQSAKVDPMHQFTIEPLAGTENWELAGFNIAFTNSALWMLIT